ncbi:MAG: DNA starvation/stationary phase protection protein [Saprospiraceae bacterium]|nr:DNA starvation/stationary phase protection protein [Saprospiraceae bacterium]
MKPEIGITDKNLKSTVTTLAALLADEMILYIKTRKFHWNVSGERFMELHKLFESQYKELELSIDELAERIGKLGQKTIGTIEEFSKLTALKEHPGVNGSADEMIKELLSDHQAVIVELRKGVDQCADKTKDAGTADLLTKLMEQHETMAWVLRRYLN